MGPGVKEARISNDMAQQKSVPSSVHRVRDFASTREYTTALLLDAIRLGDVRRWLIPPRATNSLLLASPGTPAFLPSQRLLLQRITLKVSER